MLSRKFDHKTLPRLPLHCDVCNDYEHHVSLETERINGLRNHIGLDQKSIHSSLIIFSEGCTSELRDESVICTGLVSAALENMFVQRLNLQHLGLSLPAIHNPTVLFSIRNYLERAKVTLDLVRRLCNHLDITCRHDDKGITLGLLKTHIVSVGHSIGTTLRLCRILPPPKVPTKSPKRINLSQRRPGLETISQCDLQCGTPDSISKDSSFTGRKIAEAGSLSSSCTSARGGNYDAEDLVHEDSIFAEPLCIALKTPPDLLKDKIIPVQLTWLKEELSKVINHIGKRVTTGHPIYHTQDKVHQYHQAEIIAENNLTYTDLMIQSSDIEDLLHKQENELRKIRPSMTETANSSIRTTLYDLHQTNENAQDSLLVANRLLSQEEAVPFTKAKEYIRCAQLGLQHAERLSSQLRSCVAPTNDNVVRFPASLGCRSSIYSQLSHSTTLSQPDTHRSVLGSNRAEVYESRIRRTTPAHQECNRFHRRVVIIGGVAVQPNVNG